jgi:hypothetical protein
VDGGVFEPERFFVGRTLGWGEVRMLGGKVRRCMVSTVGRMDETYNALHFDETFFFDDGQVDEWRWAMTRQSDGRYVAAEAMAGAGIVGRYEGNDYVLGFRRPLRPEGGFPTPRFRTRFTLVSPDVAQKRVRISILGLPVATMTVFHEKVD